MDFICPICRGSLTTAADKTKKCPKGHSFDRARAGYYNLLPPRGGGCHGDNREMTEARRAFLSGGYYAPLATRVAEIVRDLTPALGTVLDAGAGEGYYTAMCESALFDRDGDSSFLAFDISKDAMRYAAKAAPRVSFAVASSYDMPLADGSVDTVVNLFSPLAPDEVRRVLRTGGHFVFVFPDAEHLFGLKARIYDTPYKNEPQKTDLEGFTCLSDESLSYTLKLETPEAVRSLFMMTPYAYRTSKVGRERILALDCLECEAAFRILVYKRA